MDSDTLLSLLKELNQDHIISKYSESSAEEQGAFLSQINHIETTYPGGLREYISRAKVLLENSKNNVNPYNDYTPSVPEGFNVKVGNEDFYIDQLFYHVRLHCFVVVELKAVKFAPEHIGQLNFYVSAVDSQLRTQGDNPTIGLLICKDKDNIVAEYTLRNIESPIGVSSIQIYNELMSDYKSSLPSIEDIERELSDNCR